MMIGTACLRPPVAFIVEGDGEHQALPSIASRTMNGLISEIPTAHAHGNGGVIRNVAEHLMDVVKTHHPLKVIVVLDEKDALDDTRFECKAAVVSHILSEANAWLTSEAASAFEPLPEVSVVLECPEFESWLIADCEGLATSELVQREECRHDCTNVDVEIRDPSQWLAERLCVGVKLKKKGTPKALIARVRPQIARRRSASFERLCNRIEDAYSLWEPEYLRAVGAV